MNNINPKKYSYHVYDVNLISIIETLKTEFATLTNDKLNKRPKFIEHVENIAHFYCINYNRGEFEFYSKNRIPLIVPSSDNFFGYGLGLMLMFFDKHKIFSVLNYHKEHFSGNNEVDKDNYTSMIEFAVYDYVKTYSDTFDNSERLQKIMDWVNYSRDKDSKYILKKTEPNTLTNENIVSKFLYEMEVRKKISTDFKQILRVVLLQKTTKHIDKSESHWMTYAIIDFIEKKGLVAILGMKKEFDEKQRRKIIVSFIIHNFTHKNKEIDRKIIYTEISKYYKDKKVNRNKLEPIIIQSEITKLTNEMEVIFQPLIS